MKTRICFDMDGTIADFYAVKGWLEMLKNYDATCYTMAKPMGNFSQFARLLNKAQKNGYELVIISWSSKCSNDDFDAMVSKAKREWLHKHLPSVHWDEINIVPYGQNKSNTCHACENDILFDDEARNREGWAGKAFTPDMIVEILKNLEKGVDKTPFPML